MTKVFISYSHDSDMHRERILSLSDHLRDEGIDCWIDQYEPAPIEGWPRKMDQEIRTADFVLMACTEIYLKRLQLEEEEGKGLGVAWEGSLIYNTLYRDGTLNSKFIPIIFNSQDKEYIPIILFGYTHYDLSLPNTDGHLYRHLRGELGAKKPILGKERFVRTIHSDALPTVEGELFGRKGELGILDEALLNPDTHVVQFVASGGTGKTKLLRYWLDENHDKIEALIAWSFYSQGAGEDKQISATPFFIQALKSLGTDKSISDFETEEEKGEYIADLLRHRRCLLVLDGLEPLQQIGRGMRGELKDRAMRKLLRCLVGNHNSLCIITTRLPVHELQGRRQMIMHDLQNLEPQDGVSLLRSFGVSGSDVDMLVAVNEYGRHALALHLLGNALATYLDGDVRKRDTLTELIGDYDDIERHAFKVMQSYELWLKGTPELKLLYLLGLFDHPVDQEVLDVLWKAGIPSLTEGVEKKEWSVAQRDLTSKYRMMSAYLGQEKLFDTHPLIREFFGRKLKDAQPDVYSKAHTVLYEYYKDMPTELWGIAGKEPDTLEKMQPLFHAVKHGCKAGLHKKAFYEVYFPRIQHGNKNYLVKVLGSVNNELIVLTNFFLTPWSSVAKDFSPEEYCFLKNSAGMNLKFLGRIDESIQPMADSFGTYLANEDYSNASVIVGNLVEADIELGKIEDAISFAKTGLTLAEGSKNLFERMASHCAYADALHQLGKIAKSRKEFGKAETVKKIFSNNQPNLNSYFGYKYCDLLLTLQQFEAVIQRASQSLKISKDFVNNGLAKYDVGLDLLILGRAYSGLGKSSKALEKINMSLECLLSTGQLGFISLAYLAQGAEYRKQGEFCLSLESLSRVWELAEPAGMKLHLVDYHLEMTRLNFAAGPKLARCTEVLSVLEADGCVLTLSAHIEEAEKLIEQTNYHRRNQELFKLKQQVKKALVE